MQDWIKAILIWAFLLFWVYIFSTALYAGGCADEKKSPEKRFEICQTSKRLNGFLYTRYQEANNSFLIGLALADLGESDAATKHFAFALVHAGAVKKITSKQTLFRYLSDSKSELEMSDAALASFIAALEEVLGVEKAQKLLRVPS